ncbi:LysR family transcriptional regulator [uncultured Enterovirga sp.]|uniref:LysR family transcriptional regulator n=1 Tax=uncultured Enterovirga sp. TaxID=2026352 RepID=UPI0035C98310
MLLRKIRCFVEVARRGSFTAAAQQLRLSQPSLGAHVRQLEERYGIALFDRHGRGATLTAAGRRLFPQAEALLAEADRTELALRAMRQEEPARLLFGVTPTAQATLAPELLQRCAVQRPGTELVLIPGLSDDLRRQIEAGDIDAAVHYGRPGEAADGSRALYAEDLYLVGKPGALGRGRTVAFAELPSVPLVLERRFQVFRRLLEQVAAERGLQLDVRHEVEPVDAKRALIRRYGVFAVAPLGLFLDEIRGGEMGAWRIVSPHLRFTLYLARRSGLPEPLSQALDRWLDASVAAIVAAGELRWHPLA